MQRSFAKRLGYGFLHIFCRLFGVILFRIRVKGRENQVPGGALICSNHQSFFDPVLIGLAFEERMNYLARKTLFKFPPFRWLIEYLDAIPIDRESTAGWGRIELPDDANPATPIPDDANPGRRQSR